MRYLISAVVDFIFGGVEDDREVRVNWTLDRPPTKQELEKLVDDFVKTMAQQPNYQELRQAIQDRTYSFEITGIFGNA